MRKLFLISALLLAFAGVINAQEVQYLSQEEFRKTIFDYSTETEWNYKGNMPCIIDFYYTWCGPCKRLSPIMDELAKEYKGKVRFYKVDAEKENGLSGAFGIHSCPTILLVTKDKKARPYMVSGLRPKEDWVKWIDEVLLGK